MNNPIPVATENKFNVEKIRQQFPILHQEIYGHPLVYFDNAATTQKPQCVIDAIQNYYSHYNSNVHRGVHALSAKATEQYENARSTIAQFINAPSSKEIVFTRGTTESINLVAQSYARTFLKAGDEILISLMEHHSNIVPWQLLCEQTGIVLNVVPINEQGELELKTFETLLSEKTKLVAITHISNALGTINPVKKMIELSHHYGARVLIDGAQAAPHTPIDVTDLNCDFYAFSGHKVYAPTGVGALFAKEAILNAMPPYQGGGEMIKMVSFSKTVYNDVPHKFEAGTPNISGVIGFAHALKFIQKIGLQNIAEYERGLLEHATYEIKKIPGIRLLGEATHKASILSFLLDGIHAHDIGTILDRQGIAIRTGHHCAMPIMEHFGIAATARASFAFYNTKAEVDTFIAGIEKVKEVFQV